MLTLEEREFRAKLLNRLDKLTEEIHELNENIKRYNKENSEV